MKKLLILRNYLVSYSKYMISKLLVFCSEVNKYCMGNVGLSVFTNLLFFMNKNIQIVGEEKQLGNV